MNLILKLVFKVLMLIHFHYKDLANNVLLPALLLYFLQVLRLLLKKHIKYPIVYLPLIK